MLVMNLDQNNIIKKEQIEWSLWLCIACSGGYLLSFVLFCVNRILSSKSNEHHSSAKGLRKSSTNSSKYFLQTF